MSSLETSEGKLNLKRAFGGSDTAQKKPKLENHGEIKEEPELELDEKVSLGLDTGLASINGIVKSLKKCLTLVFVLLLHNFLYLHSECNSSRYILSRANISC